MRRFFSRWVIAASNEHPAASVGAAARTRRLASSLVACALLVASCAAFGSGRVGQGDRALVRLFDAKNDLLLEVANSSHPELSDIYSTTRSSASLKLADDLAMSDLLDAIDRSSFPQLATSEAPSSSAGLRGFVTVREGDESRTLAVPEVGATAEQLETFVTLKELVAAFYQATGALQSIENPAGPQIFDETRP